MLIHRGQRRAWSCYKRSRPVASPWSHPASWSHAVVASKFINTQHEAQTTKQDQKIPQAREKERRHDSADRLLGALHTRELNRTSNPTYALRGWEMRVQSLGNRRGSIQPVARIMTSRTTGATDQDKVLVARMACTSRGRSANVNVNAHAFATDLHMHPSHFNRTINFGW